MARKVKCPKCATVQELSDNCVKCNLDFRAYARHLRQKREAQADAGGPAAPSGPGPSGHKRRIVKCPKCSTSQPLGDNCISCGMDFKAHMAKLRAQRASAQGGEAPAFPPMAGGVTFAKGGLRPLGKLFEDAWLIYRERFVTLFFLNLLIPVFMIVPMVVLGLLGLSGAVFGQDMAAVGVGLGVMLGFLIGFVLMAIPMAGLISAIHDKDLGLKAALAKGRLKIWSYLWAMGLVSYIVPAGFFLFFIPGVLFLIWFMFAQYIVIAEDDRGMKSLLKSKAYAQGYWWPLFGRLFLIGLISSLVGTTGVGSLLFQPFMFVMFYLMYRDLRQEKGHDVSYPQSGLKWVLVSTLVYLVLTALVVIAVIFGGKEMSGFDSSDFEGRLSPGQRPASSRSMDMDSVPAIETMKDEFAQGEAIEMHYSGMSGSNTDWFTLVPAGNSESSYGQWFYTEGNTSGSYTFGGQGPGQYEIRAYFDYSGGGGYDVKARKRITVTGGPGDTYGQVPSEGVAAGEFVPDENSSLLMDNTEYAPSESATVHFIAPEGLPSNAWIGIIPSHVPHGSEQVNDGHDISYQYLNGQASGSMIFTVPAEPGEYDFRMHDTDSGGRELIFVSFTVTAGASGTGTSVLPAGGDTSNFTPDPKASLRLDDTHYAPLQIATVHYTAPPGLPDEAWIGIVPSDVAHGSESLNNRHDLELKYLGGSASGSMAFTVPSAPGQYDLRMSNPDGRGRELAFVTFTVTAP